MREPNLEGQLARTILLGCTLKLCSIIMNAIVKS